MGQLNLWTKEPKAQGQYLKLKLKLLESVGCEHDSHNLWRACFSSTIQNMPIIMSNIVWENLKIDFCWFWAIFWKILTKYNDRKPVFYHLGPKKYEKVHFLPGIRHLWNQKKVVSTKSAITTKIVGSSELFLDVQMWN